MRGSDEGMIMMRILITIMIHTTLKEQLEKRTGQPVIQHISVKTLKNLTPSKQY